jgi:glycosyltransferase involved in cell wall biosynthesis
MKSVSTRSFDIIDISVILPVYNGSLFLREAIDSILAQTYANFELIIFNDGSKDNSASIVKSYSDTRIRFYQQENQGLAVTLNNCISVSNGKYIARQDQDDISLPDRLVKQVEFLENNHGYGMVGTWAEIWEGETPSARFHKHSANNLELKFDLLFNNPFVHSSMMVRKSVFDEIGGYATDQERQPPEDYELWSRIARKFKVANLPETLHIYREMPQSMSRTGDNPFLRHLLKINVENLACYTLNRYSEQAYHDLAALSHGEYNLYSRKTSLQQMIEIIRHASQTLVLEVNDEIRSVQGSVESSITRLKYHYYQVKYASAFGRIASQFVHRVARLCKRLFPII